METQPTYRDLLKKGMQERAARNPRYSLRAYARDLGVSPASLSLILKGKQGLSLKRAQELTLRLGFNSSESHIFCDLVQSEHARSAKDRENARARVRNTEMPENILQLDLFQVMSDWHHMAILELTEVKGFKSNYAWIARQLGLTEKNVELAIERLMRLGMLKEVNGKWKQTHEFLATPTDLPSDTIKAFHQQVLNKASEAIVRQPVEERDFGAIVFAMDDSDLAWAKQQIRKFRRALMARLERSQNKNRVYCLSSQLFALQEKNVHEGEN